MKNPTRRNRNIGTSKQGHGQDNKLVIPYPAIDSKSFFERLGKYQSIEREINGHKFKFVVETTRKNSFHTCTIDDIEKIIENIPKKDYGDLYLIILRQPTRKEETLNPVWGRLIYSYEFENNFFPAIIIESIDIERKFRWDKKLNIEHQKELKRLKTDGHKFVIGKRYYESEYKLENIRTTQLYRTLLHEFGHYFQYQNIVLNPLTNIKTELDKLDSLIGDNDTKESNPLFSKWDNLFDEYHLRIEENEKEYFSIAQNEKEIFAHKYASRLYKHLTERRIIPFDRILNRQKIEFYNLNINDFERNN